MKKQILFETDEDIAIDGWTDYKQRKYTIKPGVPIEVEEKVADALIKVYPFLKVSDVEGSVNNLQVRKKKAREKVAKDVAEKMMKADKEKEVQKEKKLSKYTEEEINQMSHAELKKAASKAGLFKPTMKSSDIREALKSI